MNVKCPKCGKELIWGRAELYEDELRYKFLCVCGCRGVITFSVSLKSIFVESDNVS